MLKSFIRFTEVSYCLPDQDECIDTSEETGSCDIESEYIMPGKAGDVINFIVERDQTSGYTEGMLKVALVSCGVPVALDIATVTEAGSQLHISAQLPEDLEDCNYQLVIYLAFQMFIESFTPETSEGECDGIVQIGIFGDPAGDFTYSIDGVNFQSSPVFENICSEDYTFYLREGASSCLVGELIAHLGGTDCSQYEGTTIQDLIDMGVVGYEIDYCTGNDFI